MDDATTENVSSNNAKPNEQTAAGEMTAGPLPTREAASKSTNNTTSAGPTITSASGIGSASTTISKSKTNFKSAYTIDDANEELSQLIISGKITSNDVKHVKAILKDYVSLKEKVEKLKSLLGRSAKAQREAKIDSEAAQKKLSQAMREIERLNRKLEKLQTRPSHLDLLMDFETNFDKALLSVGQTGGQDTAASQKIATANIGSSAGEGIGIGIDTNQESSNLDTMLLQELGEAKSRIEKLETLNGVMMSRSTQLENGTNTLEKERDDATNLAKRLKMELRMAQLESEQAQRAMMDKVASLEEMQIEIDLVTKASSKANARAAKGEQAANSLKTEKNHIQQLESQVQALKEWALASSDAKQLMKERCRMLEHKLRVYQGRSPEDVFDDAIHPERHLFTRNGSMVIGAGDIGSIILSLGEYASTEDSRFVILRWKFDVAPSDCDINFNIMKGRCETKLDFSKTEHVIKDRVIQGGAGGECEGTFNLDSACTIMWSNTKSWIRPKTVKYCFDIVTLK